MKSKPRVFVGSSTEGLPIAQTLSRCLSDVAAIKLWDQGGVKPGQFVLEGLEAVLRECQFGVFVFTPDDGLRLREVDLLAVRDNVLFELGMFVGLLGRRKSFIVIPQRVTRLRIPTDLTGLSFLYFDGDEPDRRSALTPACIDIKDAIAEALKEADAKKKDDSSKRGKTPKPEPPTYVG